MKKIRSTILLWSICCCLLFVSEAQALYTIPANDSIPKIEKQVYRGYRIHLTDIKVVTQKNNQIKISFTAINTGREQVSLGNTISTPEQLLIHFDASLQEQDLTPYADQIRRQFTQTDLRIEPGFIRRDLSMSLTTHKAVKSAEQDMVYKGTPQKSVPVSKKDQEASLKKAKSQESVAVAKAPAMDVNACSDLSIQAVKVKSKGRKNITLEITLINLGAGPARMYRDESRKTPQVALRGNFSTTDKLSRGDIVIGGDYLETKNKNPHGWIKPQETITTDVKFDMRKKSKFTPYIILELDAYNGLAECDETNNVYVLKIDE